MFQTEIPIISIILLGLAVIAVIIAIVYGHSPLRATIRTATLQKENSRPENEEDHGSEEEQKTDNEADQESEDEPEILRTEPEDLTKVSIVVTASAGTETVARFLDSINEQDYPNFEVIVVFDASPETAALLTEELEGNYPDVHFTFIPTESHNLSRPKLAVLVGIKAATGDIILTTTANTHIHSNSWLRAIAAPFNTNPDTEVVLGFSHGDYAELCGISKWYRQFDFILTSAQWLGAAATGKPYRGTRYNLAFRRETFFRNKGYAHTIFLHYGDDDLFINEIATGRNTALVLSPESVVTTEWVSSANRVWRLQKDAYSFTTRWLPKAPFVRAGVTSALQWITPLLCVAAALTALPNIIPAIIAVVILLTFWGIEIATYRRLAASLGAIRLWWAVIPFRMLRPISNHLFKLTHRRQRVKNYTWQR
jgi:glycosyltransferase involved in cell wall biosynthesis/Sec-independent protein translocase protein TatA